ncbi:MULTISPECIES: N-acetyltransferase [Sanguibacteroides]|uniref:N-acetyltransferase domain-containing protein n=1 Tax=Sanguibacteroides justesenii TaxID=1547597 RepID=A0A0C3NFS1_9PORP|nr:MULTISPECIES: N-acetyltransferase [Sanguibacteroides]KIO43269.1 hypothetical protein IE90_13790 [Sanguibacteroides justesenii]KIO44982.1 hypothetical protein BA92_08185 [Sanguibacteroides justesenii]PXZ42859.1 GNAT family N-acetyltransferase [Sanguibacteroides justesenii]
MIRKYTVPDEDVLVKIWLEASSLAHDFIPESFWSEQVEKMKHLYLPSSETWIHEGENGEIDGFVSLVGNYMAALFVRPDRQKMGIGGALMRWVKRKYERLELNVYTKNISAVAFYEWHGFKVLRRQIDEMTGCEEFVMVYEG